MDRAAVAVSRAQAAPRQVRDEALVLATSPDPTVVALALRALGLCAMELGDLEEADRRLAGAARAAEALGDPALAAESHLSRSTVLGRLGRLEEGFAAAESARPALPVELAGRYHLQVGLLHHRNGQEAEATTAYGLAITALEAAGDLEIAARARNNQALLLAARGDLAAAEEAMTAVWHSYRDGDDDLGAAKARHNLALIQAARGDLHEALAAMAETEATFVRLGVDRSVVLADHCRVLINAGLADDAWAVGQAALAALRTARSHLDLVELELALGFLAITEDRHVRAERHLLEAAELARTQERPDLAALGERARLLADALTVPGAPTGPAPELPPGATDASLRDAAAAATLHVAVRLLDRGDTDALPTVLPRRHRPRPAPALERARVTTAAAILAVAEGNDRRARAGLRAAHAHLDRHLRGLGSTDLRASTLRQAGYLETVGLRMAARTGDVADVYEWTERHRSTVARLRAPARTAPELARLLEELRGVRHQLADPDPDDRLALRRRQAGIERRIRQLGWRRSDLPAAGLTGPPDLGELRQRLGGRTAVSFAESAGSVLALIITAGDVRVVPLGPVPPIAAGAAGLRLAADAAAGGAGGPDDLLTQAAALDDRLCRPLGLDDGPVVFVPTATLSSLPWSALPSLRGRPVTLAGSLSDWRPPGHSHLDRALLVAGPRLAHAASEARQVGDLYGSSTLLLDAEASVGEVEQHLGRCDVAHVVAHGEWRRDRPSFSNLELADGRWFVEDVERVPALPRLVVWSACDLGRSADGGLGVAGLAPALSGRECETLVGATGRVVDDEAGAAMVAFHRRLRQGAEPAVALAEVQAATLQEGAVSVCTFTAFAIPA